MLPGASEVRSWERSIPLLAAALNDAGLGDVEVKLEYALPLNSKRADVVLAGLHPVTQEPSYVVVELKQWSQAAPHEDDPTLCHVDAYAHPVLNPIEQVRRYCDYLVNFNGAVAEHGERIQGVAGSVRAPAGGRHGRSRGGRGTALRRPPARCRLREQFRCGGSDAYIRRVRGALGGGEEAGVKRVAVPGSFDRI
ncbi:hypothetical protein GA0115259_109652 [Streptomyces sp. MnatMP-M17]|nr:hypothetical protein GA0115259_109652 [Streptomyces sp. MnatMP-M17]